MVKFLTTFDKYIDNPMGGSVLVNSATTKSMYTQKFSALLIRESNHLQYTIYRTVNFTDSYIIHFKIPSETYAGLYYDVVIELYTRDNKLKNSASLRQYNVRFFSNDPRFMYVFANTFAGYDLFVKDLKPKMSRKALKNKATVTNQFNTPGWVKSLYFAYLAMEKYGLFERPMLNQNAEKYSRSKLLANVKHSNTIMEEIDSYKAAARDKKQKEKRASDSRTNQQKQPNANIKYATKTSKITPTTKFNNTTKVSKTTKKTGVVGKKS